VPSLHRELALIKVAATSRQRGEIFQVADVFRAKIMDVGVNTMVLEVTGVPGKIDDFLKILSPYNIKEVARSGLISVPRGKKD
jgi:acetolactate synthase-1/3 small subunit